MEIEEITGKSVEEALDELVLGGSLTEYIMEYCEDWREHYDSNYAEKHDEYYRLWRGIWSEEDRTRKSERSKIITPALQQAVESNVAELEEATFGRGKWFDIKDNVGDNNNIDIQVIRERLEEDFEMTKVRKAVAEVLINAAVYGTGIAELALDVEKKIVPKVVPTEGEEGIYGTVTQNKVVVKMRPVLPQNFLIDPVATCVEDAMAVAIDEFVPRHQVEKLQEEGVYANVYLEDAPQDSDLDPDSELHDDDENKIRLTKWYGLVPTDLLKGCSVYKEPEGEELPDTMYTEAIVVIANGGTLLKASPNPYMMEDRPVVAFPWDVVPGRFWGRGVCEKGYNSQKALDAEIRARIDALALTVHPMMAMDATRIPRGARPEVRPGRTILTNGNPSEALMPLSFGNVDQITFAQASALQQMVQQATGAVDSAGIAGQINGEATAAGISMSLGAIIKRHKRTLINFQQGFLLPFVQKAAFRYMQYDPERYPASDFTFTPTSTLGIIAREYEVTQLTQLLQTMSPETPLYPALIESIVDNMNLSNREELIATLREASKPNPEVQKAQQEAQQAEINFKKAQTEAMAAEGEKSRANAEKYRAEAKAVPIEMEFNLIRALTNDLKDGSEDTSFQKRLELMDRRLQERKLQLEGQKHNDKMRLDIIREARKPTGQGQQNPGEPKGEANANRPGNEPTSESN